MSTHEEHLANGKLELPSGMSLIGKGDEVVLRRNFFMRTPIAVETLIKLIRDNGIVFYRSESVTHTERIQHQSSNQLELYYLFEESASGHWDNCIVQVLDCDGDKVIFTDNRHSMEFWKKRSSYNFTRTSISADILVKLIEES